MSERDLKDLKQTSFQVKQGLDGTWAGVFKVTDGTGEELAFIEIRGDGYEIIEGLASVACSIINRRAK